MHLHSLLALVAQLDVRSTSDQEVTDFDPRQVQQDTFERLLMKYFL